ncbi:substrate-binding domain-containing protein [Aureimonas sp. SK2]|uniref:substrate-binding domain-containing protein n=1 Tax=Aureimonas sp. SK2 TaxID=3015992 RepID=UPI00387EA30F
MCLVRFRRSEWTTRPVRSSTPPMTSVHSPEHTLGAVAIDILCEEMGSPGRPARPVELARSLVERASGTSPRRDDRRR